MARAPDHDLDDEQPAAAAGAPRAPTVERAWSEADVLTLSEAARRLRARRVDVETWLRQIGIVSRLPFGERVSWGAVLRALDPAAAPRPTRPGGRVVSLPAGHLPIR